MGLFLYMDIYLVFEGLIFSFLLVGFCIMEFSSYMVGLWVFKIVFMSDTEVENFNSCLEVFSKVVYFFFWLMFFLFGEVRCVWYYYIFYYKVSFMISWLLNIFVCVSFFFSGYEILVLLLLL